MSLHRYLCELLAKGAQVYIENGALQASAPPGVMTSEVRAYLRENRAAVMSVLSRREIVKTRLEAARAEAFKKESLRWDIDLSSDPLYSAAEAFLDSKVVEYIDGEIDIEAVGEIWKELIRVRSLVTAAQYAAV